MRLPEIHSQERALRSEQVERKVCGEDVRYSFVVGQTLLFVTLVNYASISVTSASDTLT